MISEVQDRVIKHMALTNSTRHEAHAEVLRKDAALRERYRKALTGGSA